MLRALRVAERCPQHLEPSADAQHRRAARSQLQDRRLQPAPAQPEKVVHRVFRAGQDHHVRSFQLPQRADEAHPQRGVVLQRGEIGEIGNAGQADDRDIDGLMGPGLVQDRGQGILVVDLRPGIGDHPQHRDAGLLLQHGETGPQDLHIAPELVDDRADDPLPLLRLQKRYRPEQLGKHPAAVDVSHQEHRGVHQLRQTHVHDIVRLQIDLRRTARPLDHKDVVLRAEAPVRGQDLGDQGLFHPEIVPGGVIAPDLPVHDQLAACVAGGLQEDGVHPHVRLLPSGLGLDCLSPAHLQPIQGDVAVQGHVLALEGRRPITVLGEDPAQGRGQQALADSRHGALHHDTFCHQIHLLSVRRSAAFSSGVRTAARYHPGARPGKFPQSRSRTPSPASFCPSDASGLKNSRKFASPGITRRLSAASPSASSGRSVRMREEDHALIDGRSDISVGTTPTTAGRWPEASPGGPARR